MVELQRLARTRKLTLLEAKEVILRMRKEDLTMQEQCWLESARKLVLIMPPSMLGEVKCYDLSSYPLKLIPHPGAPPVPSMSTGSRCPLILTSLTTNPPATVTIPCPSPAGASTSITPTPCLLPVANLICAIFQTAPSHMLSSALPYQLAMRRPLSAMPMAVPNTTVKSGVIRKSPLPLPTTPHPLTGQMLYQLGSYEAREPDASTSPSWTYKESPSSPTTYRL